MVLNLGHHLSLLGRVRLREFRLCYVKLGYTRLMYLMLRQLFMVGHDSYTLTSLSLLYRFVNIIYVRTLFLLQNTFCHAWSHLVTLCHELFYILGFDLYTAL
jgi:hypothetical protein